MDRLLIIGHPRTLYDGAEGIFKLFIPSILHMVLCFVLLGICASEYLCPNVAGIADSRDHAGSTGALMAVLLSWCNSSPDLFSNFMSWTSGSSESDASKAAALSFGEVLGACGIILCVVQGSIFIVMSTVDLNITATQRYSVIRDLLFTLTAMLFMGYICLRNSVTTLNCITMILIYAAYLITKLNLYQDRQAQEVRETPIELSPTLSAHDHTNLPTGTIKPSILSALDYVNLFEMLEESRSGEGEQQDAFDGTNNDIVRPSTEPITSTSQNELEIPFKLPHSSPTAFGPYHDLDDENIEAFPPDMLLEMYLPTSKKSTKLKRIRTNIFKIFLPHLLNFRQKTTIDAILSVLTAPFVIILRLSCPQMIPTLEYDEAVRKYRFENLHIFVMLLQSLVSPMVSMLVLSCLIQKRISQFVWIFPIGVSTVLVILTLAYYQALLKHNKFSLLDSNFLAANQETSEQRRTVEYLENIANILFPVVGIVASILWISLFANSLIELLEIYQRVTGVSEGILGLTVFAWGNSVSDLISNIAMCRLYKQLPEGNKDNIQNMATKFFIISCSSCLGGVLLNSMGGIGISGLISMLLVHKTSNKWWFLRYTNLSYDNIIYDYKFVVCCVTIILQTLLLLVFFAGSGRLRELLTNRMYFIGLAMCGLWGLATTLNVIFECIT